MSHPPYSPYPPEPAQPPYGGQQGYPPPQQGYPPQQPQGYPQPGIPQQPQGYSAPPGTGYQPHLGAGGYPPPQSPYGTPYGAPEPVKKKSPVLRIILVVVAIIAVLCVGGIAVVYLAGRDTWNQMVDATNITVVEPATLGGRPKVTDPTVVAAIGQLDDELAKVPGATGSVGAAYGDVAKQDIVMVAAASTLTGTPQGRFDEFVAGMRSGGMNATFTDIEPGPLGGIAKCGDSTSDNVPMAVCVWSDNGSIGMFAMLGKSKTQLVKEFVTMRGEVEKRK